jgi:hypothetical protein
MRLFVFSIFLLSATCVSACSSSHASPPAANTYEQRMRAAAGGTLKAPGVTLEIPPGALAADTTITLTIHDKEGEPDEGNIEAPIFEFGPDGTTFSRPARMTLDFVPAASPKGDAARIAYLKSGAWVSLGDSVVQGQQVTATTTHFTPYTAVSGIVVDPNTITGQVGFSNTNPAVLALMASNGFDDIDVTATSSPAGYSSTTGIVATTSPTLASCTLFAEAGVTYDVSAVGWVYRLPGGNGNGQYDFQPKTGVVLPPAGGGGATADLIDCVGVTRFTWGTDSTCATPVAIDSGSINTHYGFNDFGHGATQYLFLPDGATDSTTLYYTFGTDPTMNTVSYAMPVTLSSTCDVIQDVCIPVPGGPAAAARSGASSSPSTS